MPQVEDTLQVISIRKKLEEGIGKINATKDIAALAENHTTFINAFELIPGAEKMSEGEQTAYKERHFKMSDDSAWKLAQETKSYQVYVASFKPLKGKYVEKVPKMLINYNWLFWMFVILPLFIYFYIIYYSFFTPLDLNKFRKN